MFGGLEQLIEKWPGEAAGSWNEHNGRHRGGTCPEGSEIQRAHTHKRGI